VGVSREKAIKVLGIDNILLAVGDLDEAREFYGERLGLPIKFAIDRMSLICFALGSEEPGLLVRVEPGLERAIRRSPRIWVEVPDARIVADSLSDVAIEQVAPPFEVATGWAVEVSDPGGTSLDLPTIRKHQ
jgi:catechol 2,3-dioxygenase-like lactoylglutathione lyase family enzyme